MQRPGEQPISEAVIQAWLRLGASLLDIQRGVWIGDGLWARFGLERRSRSLDAMLRLVYHDDRPRVRRTYEGVIAGEVLQQRKTYRIQLSGGGIRWIQSELAHVRERDGRRFVAALDRDVTSNLVKERELHRACRQAERSAYEADVLSRAGAIFVSTFEIVRIVSSIIEQAKAVVPYDTASVQLLRDGYLEVVGGTGRPNSSDVLGIRFTVPGNNPNTRVIQTGLPLRLDSLSPSDWGDDNAAVTAPFSWIGVPLVIHGNTIGMLTFDNRRPGYFNEQHLRLAAGFGDHVAVALYNAQLFEETQQLAMTDSLTGLMTRRAFFMNAEAFLEHAKRHEYAASILMIDIDEFKPVNDRYGHQRGDLVLSLVADAIRRALRDSDLVGRYGGEEFVALMTETTEDQAYEVGERVRGEVQSLNIDWIDYPLTVSIGLATGRGEEDTTLEKLVEQADTACYRAKREGRNRVCR